MNDPLSKWILIITAGLVVSAAIFAGLGGAIVIICLATFFCYGIDKWQARRDGRRISEATLHLLALCGGSPGAAFGQIVFRHKTSKPSFRRVFFAIVIAQSVALIIWVFVL